ncbi:hypothetical protein BC332_09930, partial [Capsicum chinense]
GSQYSRWNDGSSSMQDNIPPPDDSLYPTPSPSPPPPPLCIYLHLPHRLLPLPPPPPSSAIMKSFEATSSDADKPDKFLAYMVPAPNEVRGDDADDPTTYAVTFGETEAHYMVVGALSKGTDVTLHLDVAFLILVSLTRSLRLDTLHLDVTFLTLNIPAPPPLLLDDSWCPTPPPPPPPEDSMYLPPLLPPPSGRPPPPPPPPSSIPPLYQQDYNKLDKTVRDAYESQHKLCWNKLDHITSTVAIKFQACSNKACAEKKRGKEGKSNDEVKHFPVASSVTARKNQQILPFKKKSQGMPFLAMGGLVASIGPADFSISRWIFYRGRVYRTDFIVIVTDNGINDLVRDGLGHRFYEFFGDVVAAGRECVPNVDFDSYLLHTRYASMLWHYGSKKEEEKAQSDDEAPMRPLMEIGITKDTEGQDI